MQFYNSNSPPAGVGSLPGRPGGVQQERGGGEEVGGGEPGTAAPPQHSLGPGGGEAGGVPGGGNHSVVLSLHHRPQPDNRGVHRDGRHRAGGAPRESSPRTDEDPGRRR